MFKKYNSNDYEKLNFVQFCEIFNPVVESYKNDLINQSSKINNFDTEDVFCEQTKEDIANLLRI